MATIKVPVNVPTPEEDAERLRKAFAGLGTDRALIIEILAHRSASQRNLIRQAYSAAYGEDLLKDLDKELLSDFERVVLLWTMDPSEQDAYLFNEAIKTKNYLAIMEIACTRSSRELVKIRQTYHARYKKSLEEDVSYNTGGNCRKMLVPLVSALRYEGDEVDMALANSEAILLIGKIREREPAYCYIDEEVVRILTTRSKAQLNATVNEYKNRFRRAIDVDLQLDFLRETVKCLTCPEKYYEKTLCGAINKRVIDKKSLTRVIVTLAEVNMQSIKEEYLDNNCVTLEKAITGDACGDYERTLLALIGHEDDAAAAA